MSLGGRRDRTAIGGGEVPRTSVDCGEGEVPFSKAEKSDSGCTMAEGEGRVEGCGYVEGGVHSWDSSGMEEWLICCPSANIILITLLCFLKWSYSSSLRAGFMTSTSTLLTLYM